MITKEDIRKKLKEVLDPELGINIVDLGLVYDVSFKKDTAHITMTLTTMGCPLGPTINKEIEKVLKDLPGIKKVSVEVVWTPPWNQSMMSEDAKDRLLIDW